jgi:F0F1-type ATP synthase membrane subunit a
MSCKRQKYLILFLTFVCLVFVSNMVNASGLKTTETLCGPYEVYTKGVGLEYLQVREPFRCSLMVPLPGLISTGSNWSGRMGLRQKKL